jgi:hypothetical protein
MESVTNVEAKNETGMLEGADLVLGLLAPSPSAPFVLKRFNPDGSVKEFPFRIKVLRRAQNLTALSEAQKRAKELGETDEKYGDIYKECQATAILARSLCSTTLTTRPDGVEDYRPLFVNAQQLDQSLTEGEMAQCLNALELTKAKFSAIESFDPVEIDKWAARLSDTLLGPFFLSRLDYTHWPELLTSLALEVRSLRESLGRPLPSLHDSSESPPSTSGNGTGGSTVSLSEPLSDGMSETVQTPLDKLLSQPEARALAKKRRK